MQRNKTTNPLNKGGNILNTRQCQRQEHTPRFRKGTLN
uniref:Uncharacterized protein n=1 Tax=Anguilla anguilla TaxID=7936 RepID=A0A0E9U7Y0_ANGAN